MRKIIRELNQKVETLEDQLKWKPLTKAQLAERDRIEDILGD